MSGREHSAIGVLPSAFPTLMSLQHLWVEQFSLIVFTTAERFITVTLGLRCGLSSAMHTSNGADVSKCHGGRQHIKDPELFPHPFHTPMSLQQLWVANDSLASSSADHFAVDIAIKASYDTPQATKAINFMVLM